MRIWDIMNEGFLTDEDSLMRLAGIDPRMGYEGIGLQDDGTPIVCDKCGNFGYLDPIKYRLLISYGEE